mmetsp:Transcript_16713/g.23576  ORF Transcript_16713/g.23576 Transcript_16713/m.23576 type:complete len:472 (+) Transcript_16713:98-1513(+)
MVELHRSSCRDDATPARIVEEDNVVYQTGFGNSFESEILPGALPRGRNNPRLCPFNLYAEQLSGTAFTSPRHINRRTWLYRIQPGVTGSHHTFSQTDRSLPKFFGGTDPKDFRFDPNPLRWKPMPSPEKSNTTFITGMKTLMMSGDPATKFGLSVSMYTANTSMGDTHIYNSDGDFLIVPETKSLVIQTELGLMTVHPKEICVIPRGIVFRVQLEEVQENTGFARGYVLEVYQGHFALPELGPIGSNGLANARDFLHPTAKVVPEEEYRNPCTILNKFGNELFHRHSTHSPYNVVAWHGNYAPFKYSLERFCAANSVTYDHLDPSIYTVLTCVGNEPGTALADFVIFPPRIMATDSNTFRPPWFHRNTMSEFMGLIEGCYDAKEGFLPGGASLHSTMTPHGPDSVTYNKAVADKCEYPTKFNGGLAFMFETSCLFKLSSYALECKHCDDEYATCWSDLADNFQDGWELLKE